MSTLLQPHRVTSVVAIDGGDASSLLALAARVAGSLEPSDTATATGVVACVDSRTVALGNPAFLAALGVPLAELGDGPERIRQRGDHVLLVAIDGLPAGFVGFANTPADEQTTTFMEEEMRASQLTANDFPTETAGVTKARAADVIRLADGERYDLRIAPVTKQLGDANVRLLAYNGSIPGPTLRVRQGSEVLVDVVNDADLETTVHWHGLRLDNRYDGTLATQPAIPVGGTFTHRLSFPDPGIYWYHPHIREDYGQEMGLYGTIVVEPADADYWPKVHRELTITLDDILIEDGRVAPFNRNHPTYTAMGRFGNVMLANGESGLLLQAGLGEVVRLYLVNTANTRVFDVAIPGARMKRVGGDSGRYERETFAESVVIAPSERVVVDVQFERPGQLALQHRTPARTYRLATFDVAAEPAQPSLTAEFAVLRVNDDVAAERQAIAPYLDAEPDKALALVAVMNFGGSETPGTPVSYICPMHLDVTSTQAGRCPKCGMKLMPEAVVSASTGHAHGDMAAHDHDSPDQAAAHHDQLAGIEWEDDMVDVNRLTNPANMAWKLIDRETGAEGAAIDWRFRVGDRVKIRLVNEMDSDHPMHHPIHIHGAGRFLILSRDGVVEPNLVWKDTVLVPTGQTVDILLEVTHPGVWMAHCHIAEHHESGMMLRFNVEARHA